MNSKVALVTGGASGVGQKYAYCASRAAVNVYAETLIRELAHNHLRIFLVCLPVVDTPLID